MGNFNELTLEDVYAMYFLTGMEFTVEDGTVTGAVVPAERMIV